MKTLLILAATLLWLLAPLRAQTITIQSVDSVKIGEHDEPLIDAVLNAARRGVTPLQIQDAFRAWVKTITDATAAKETERAKIEAAATAKLAVAEKLKSAFEQGDAEKFAEASAELESAKTPEKEKRLAEIAARDAEIAAEQAKLAEEKAALEAKAEGLKR